MSPQAMVDMMAKVDPEFNPNSREHNEEMIEHFKKGDWDQNGFLDEKEFTELYHRA